MDKDQMVKDVKDKIAEWVRHAHPFAWNTGPAGRLTGPIDYTKFPEISKPDYEAAVKELKEYVKMQMAGFSGREAASGSGLLAGQNIWSFLVEPWDDKVKRKFNYHVKVTK